jgi:hypothetical protein
LRTARRERYRENIRWSKGWRPIAQPASSIHHHRRRALSGPGCQRCGTGLGL